MHKRPFILALVLLQLLLWPLHSLAHAQDSADHDIETDIECVICHQSLDDYALAFTSANLLAVTPPHVVTPIAVPVSQLQTVRHYQSRAPPLA